MNWPRILLYPTENTFSLEIRSFQAFRKVQFCSDYSVEVNNPFLRWHLWKDFFLMHDDCSCPVVHLFCLCLFSWEREILNNFGSQGSGNIPPFTGVYLVHFWQCRYESHAVYLQRTTVWEIEPWDTGNLGFIPILLRLEAVRSPSKDLVRWRLLLPAAAVT